jgi:tetratricopeptide (TPR) repeat protein
MADKGDNVASVDYLKRALELNPVNMAALELADRVAVASGDKVARVSTLLALLRGNIVQPQVMAALASELAAVGIIDQAISWYQLSFSTTQRLGQQINLDDYLTYAAVLSVAQQPGQADQAVQGILQAQPKNLEAHFLKTLIDKRSGDPGKLAQSVQVTRGAIVARLNALSQTLATGQPPGEDAPPITSMPNIVADVDKLRAGGHPQLIGPYVESLADLAWLSLFFENRPVESELLSSIIGLAGESSPLTARIVGWNFLVQGKPIEARQKLSAVPDDILSAVGLIRIRASENDPTVATDARSLILAAPRNIIGAMVFDAVRPLAGEGAIVDQRAVAVREALDAFPQARLLRLLQTPDEFYLLKAEPLKVGNLFGDAILVRVTISNKSEFPLSVGPGGLIGRRIVFDCTARGPQQQQFPATAVEELTERVRLNPRESLSQVVRVDGPELRQALGGVPMISMPLYFSVLTNPLMSEAGPVPGPGGYRKQAERVIERTGWPLNNNESKERLLNELRRGKPLTRLAMAELIASWAAQLRAEAAKPGESQEQVRTLVRQMDDAIRAAVLDEESPVVRVWCAFLMGASQSPEDRLATIRRGQESPYWVARLLAVELVSSLDREKQLELLSAMAATEKDPLVKEYANAALELAKQPPATQPTDGSGQAPASGGPR